MEDILLSARGIYKSFGATKAVRDFSMDIRRGEIRGLIGENGSGKSTFASIVAGIQGKDDGEMILNGKPYDPVDQNESAQRGVALVVQEIGTIASISAASNIFLNRENQFARKGFIQFSKMNKAAREILDQIGGEHINPAQPCGTMNLEDRKLVEIAKAMKIKPDLLIIDETSNALASHGREILYRNMRAVRERGGSVLFITHDMEELVSICDSVTIMRDGCYVETLFGAEMEPMRLKMLMVGREIAENYYRPDFTPSFDSDIVMKAENLVSESVRNVSFELHRGEILGIGGLAECGMHELGKLLFGLQKPDKGTVTLADGTRISNAVKAVDHKVGYLSKNRDTEAVLLNYRIRDNVVLPSLKKMRRGPFILKRDEKAMSEKWANELSIKRRTDTQRVRELSGGNKQKVVLAKWMARESEILIMDCPTRGIDIGVKEAIYKIMMRFKAEGRSMIMISEEMPELIGMSDRMLIMKDGAVSAEVMRGPEVKEHDLIQYMV
ncbi:MAG: sugar ABC transporter ATP-binding protein [Clostridia bacterium]|nr:sugar ABC transporter ATP-binding protein [Clostridia bacterium]